MEKRRCFVGLLGKYELIWEKNGRFYYRIQEKDEQILLDGRESDNSISFVKKAEEGDLFIKVDENMIEKDIQVDISEEGPRWEGDLYNNKPFGFGSYYDGEGNKIYSGFMFDGKKVIYGTEYSANCHTVYYCGNFLNDLRHGRGKSYDKNGDKLYEGDWVYGKKDFEDKLVIEDDCKEDCLGFHDLIKELVIGEGCFNEWKDDLVIEDYPSLETIIVKKSSLMNLNSFKICNCEKLKAIKVEDGEPWKKNGAFWNVKDVKIESIVKMFL